MVVRSGFVENLTRCFLVDLRRGRTEGAGGIFGAGGGGGGGGF